MQAQQLQSRVNMRDELMKELEEWRVNQEAFRKEKKSKLEWKARATAIESRLNSMQAGRKIKQQSKPEIDVWRVLCTSR